MTRTVSPRDGLALLNEWPESFDDGDALLEFEHDFEAMASILDQLFEVKARSWRDRLRGETRRLDEVLELLHKRLRRSERSDLASAARHARDIREQIDIVGYYSEGTGMDEDISTAVRAADASLEMLRRELSGILSATAERIKT